MRRHDCGREWPVHRGHESLCTGAHAEGAKEQSHPHSHLLAWQPCVNFWNWLSVMHLPFLRSLKENRLISLFFWFGAIGGTAGIHGAKTHHDGPPVSVEIVSLSLEALSPTNPWWVYIFEIQTFRCQSVTVVNEAHCNCDPASWRKDFWGLCFQYWIVQVTDPRTIISKASNSSQQLSLVPANATITYIWNLLISFHHFSCANISKLDPVYKFSNMCYFYFNLSVLIDDEDINLIPLKRLLKKNSELLLE